MIHGIGVSNFSLDQLKEAMAKSHHPIVAVQNYYNLANRTKTSPEFLAYCQKEQIAFIAPKPLERGLLLEEPWKSRLDPLAKKYNKTPSQIALAWLLGQENIHVIPKATSLNHIQENIEAADIVFTSEDQKYLDKIVLQ